MLKINMRSTRSRHLISQAEKALGEMVISGKKEILLGWTDGDPEKILLYLTGVHRALCIVTARAEAELDHLLKDTNYSTTQRGQVSDEAYNDTLAKLFALDETTRKKAGKRHVSKEVGKLKRRLAREKLPDNVVRLPVLKKPSASRP